ncbi:meiosis-specific transcription factor ndt80 [Phlyctochytrium planicorne]|nr:meiosis-specific transcription factor ndt80 [Phlyctochytrium planicorne]
MSSGRSLSQSVGPSEDGGEGSKEKVKRKRIREHPSLARPGECLFGSTEQIARVMGSDGEDLTFLIKTNGDSGFFWTDMWTLYRRNYFDISAAFLAFDGQSGIKLDSLPSNIQVVTESGTLANVTGFSIGVTAVVHRTDTPVRLLSYTAKRDGGPSLPPALKGCRVGGVLPCEVGESVVRPRGTEEGEREFVGFSRLQFKQSSSSVNPNFFCLRVELWARTGSGNVRVARVLSAPLSIRAKSPACYGDPQGKEEGEKKGKKKKLVKEKNNALAMFQGNLGEVLKSEEGRVMGLASTGSGVGVGVGVGGKRKFGEDRIDGREVKRFASESRSNVLESPPLSLRTSPLQTSPLPQMYQPAAGSFTAELNTCTCNHGNNAFGGLTNSNNVVSSIASTLAAFEALTQQTILPTPPSTMLLSQPPNNLLTSIPIQFNPATPNQISFQPVTHLNYNIIPATLPPVDVPTFHVVEPVFFQPYPQNVVAWPMQIVDEAAVGMERHLRMFGVQTQHQHQQMGNENVEPKGI